MRYVLLHVGNVCCEISAIENTKVNGQAVLLRNTLNFGLQTSLCLQIYVLAVKVYKTQIPSKRLRDCLIS